MNGCKQKYCEIEMFLLYIIVFKTARRWTRFRVLSNGLKVENGNDIGEGKTE
jgi:hypothetical protein